MDGFLMRTMSASAELSLRLVGFPHILQSFEPSITVTHTYRIKKVTSNPFFKPSGKENTQVQCDLANRPDLWITPNPKAVKFDHHCDLEFLAWAQETKAKKLNGFGILRASFRYPEGIVRLTFRLKLPSSLAMSRRNPRNTGTRLAPVVAGMFETPLLCVEVMPVLHSAMVDKWILILTNSTPRPGLGCEGRIFDGRCIIWILHSNAAGNFNIVTT